jgi:type IV pilus assembly protein PilY1
MSTATKKLLSASALCLALLAPGTRASDIDLFSALPTGGAAPNVLFLLDNSGAWNGNATYDGTPCSTMNPPQSKNNVGTAGGFEQCALFSVLADIKNDTVLNGSFNAGLMLFTQGSGNGGTFFFPQPPISGPLPAMDSTGIAAFQNALTNMAVGGNPNNTANGAATAAMEQEAWAVFAGKTGYSGTSYSGSVIQNPCQKNFIIYIVNANINGKPQDNTDNAAFQTLACPVGSTGPINGASCAGATAAQQAQISLDPTKAKYQGNWLDEWARFAYQTDLSGNFANQQNVVTYTIAVTDGSNPDYVELLKSAATNGGGKQFVVNVGDMDALKSAIKKIINEVQAVNSVFASASLPVSANAQGTFQNQIFMGMFRPDPVGNPRWMGNLKQYQFGIDTSSNSIELFMADATGAHALSSSGTGFISPNAISFWTSKDTTKLPDSISTLGGFWINNVHGVGAGFDSPDGEVVEKGGVGQQIRLANLQDNYDANPTSPRNLYTYCPSGSGCNNILSNSANAFATTNSAITGAMLNASGIALKIKTISRSGTTATVTLNNAPSPALSAGQTITISGSTNGYNGSYTIASVSPTNGAVFTITVAEIPPSPSQGTYVASKLGATTFTNQLVSLTRSTASSNQAVADTGTNPHGLAVGNQVTISGGGTGTFSTDPRYAAYYGTFIVASVASPTKFNYTLVEGPTTPLDAASATATIGSTTKNLTSSTNGVVPKSSIQRAASTLVGGVWTSRVTVTTTTSMATPFAAGAKVTIAGTNSQYDGTWTIAAVSGCAGEFTTGNGANKVSYSFCFDMATLPAMTNPAPTTAGAGVAETGPLSSQPIVSGGLTHPAAAGCPVSSAVTVTASTSVAHGFVAGDVINVGGTPGVNENTYLGNFTVVAVPTKTSFTYTINTRPLCTDDSTTSTNLTASSGGVTRDTLIRWVRGEDNFGDEASPGSPINIRPSVHGDVVHARPTVVNYGGSIGVVVFYGAGDGTFHAVNGNQPGASPANVGTFTPGQELWAFVPPEFYTKLLRLHDNSPVIKYFTTPTGLKPTPLDKDYFFDGIAGVYQNFNTGQVFLYLTARRGGRLIYAIDVSDPLNPQFMWKHSSADTGFSELGQTWSEAKVAIVKGSTNPVLIFGAGYDPNEDAEPPATDAMGRGIFVLDAVTGAILWRAGPGGAGTSCSGTPCLLRDMTYGVPADVTLMDIDADGLVDRAYAADLGGNIWRIDFEPNGGNTPGFWKASLFAAVGGASSDSTKRKFFFPPDAVATSKFAAVMAVTGDREHPLYAQGATSIVNRFYMLKDTIVGKDATGMVPIIDDTTDVSDVQPASLFNATTTAYDGSRSGFYVTLTNAGEKGVNAPITVGGFTFFGTNTPVKPAANACDANLGTARSYQIGFLTGSVAFNLLQGGGLPPSPVAGLVNVQVNGETITVPFIIGGSSPGCIGADCQSSIGAQKANIPIKQTRARAYWYREVDK